MAFTNGQWVPDSSMQPAGRREDPYMGRGGPAGMVWDPTVGGYVSPTQAGREKNTQTRDDAAATIAAGTAAGTYHAPMTQGEQSASELALQRLAEERRQADARLGLDRESMTASSSAEAARLAEATRAAQAGEQLTRAQQELLAAQQAGTLGLERDKFAATRADRASAMAALEKLWGGGGSSLIAGDNPRQDEAHQPAPGGLRGPMSIDYGNGGFGQTVPHGGGDALPGPVLDGTPMPTSGGGGAGGGGVRDLAAQAEQASLGGAKERTGQRLAASLRSLHELMNARGIGGSGIEGRNMRDLFASAGSDMADTERGIIQGRVGRAQQLEDQQTARGAQLEDWQRNRGASVEDRDFAAQQEMTRQKIQALLATFGMSY